MMSAEQVTLDMFKQEWTINSGTRDTKYHVTNDRGVWNCQCEHFKYRGHITDCRHIMQAKNDGLMKRAQYEIQKKPVVSSARFKSFDEVQRYFTYSKDTEIEDIANVILSLAKSDGSLTADDVHDVIKEFQHDSRIIGTAFKILRRLHYIMPGAYEKSRRAECHARPVVRWHITDEGKELVV